MLNQSNYYGQEANLKYVSASQYKDFVGCAGRTGCEAKALAKVRGEWHESPTPPMMIGAYIDAYIEGTLDEFKELNPHIFTLKGTLKSEFKKAENIISFMEQDEYFMAYLSGEKQVIRTGEICGVPIKGKFDSLLTGKAIVDLKVMASLTKTLWVRDLGSLNFIDAWGYDIQGAFYRELERQHSGIELPFIIAGVDKGEVPDHELIAIEPFKLDRAMIEIESNINHIQSLKNGEIEPIQCGKCDYCKSIKKLSTYIWSSELVGD